MEIEIAKIHFKSENFIRAKPQKKIGGDVNELHFFKDF